MADETVSGVCDPDALLMIRFKEGDTEAFDRLFNRHSRALVNFAYRFVHSREWAEEMAQEIFLRVYEGSGSYRAQAKFTTWLYRIATNVCLNEIRKPRFRAVHQSLATEEPGKREFSSREFGIGAEAERNLERQAISRVLKEALSQIPEKQRIAFILSKYQEFSYAEVAEIMKLSENAVKSLIHRAREALAKRLTPLLPELIRR